MAKHHDTGKKGEELAVQYLRNKGYDILHTNWRIGHKEIDIIAQIGNELVFVEVKSRRSLAFGSGDEAIDERKQKHMQEAAERYVEQFDLNQEVRFDIITIFFALGQYEIAHIPGAF
ncbi:MAG: YraN family protein [Candidatus Competibacteraceae bacterium]|nr:YraN family protein [Candidatus Competibacteraceae bacterium]